MKIEPSAFDKLPPYFQRLIKSSGYNPAFGVFDTVEEARDNMLNLCKNPECTELDIHAAAVELTNTIKVSIASDLAKERMVGK